MKLKQVEVEGYRSIRERAILFVEHTVTVVLGPNDHGKTNLLNALQHLNADHAYDPQDDLNWDSSERRATLPLVIGRFTLSDKEREWLSESDNKAREEINRRIAEHSTASTSEAAQDDEGVEVEGTDEDAESEEEEEEEEEEEHLPSEPLPQISPGDIPTEVSLSRIGAEGSLSISGLEQFQSKVQEDFKRFLPRIELIEPITKLSDSVSAKELGEGKNEFMRGIFYYAGLDPNDSEALFKQTDRNQMTITRASEQLNTTLRKSWSQGKNLRFRLTHHSKEEKIDLQIEDPSVATTYVRASRRSSGFTHYFSLKTILHARQKDHPAESYILLFDEPGVFLHPSGQFDLLQVIETLSLESQTLYVTHSLFMINKTFPTRHRLIMKTADGTQLDGKPYVGRWQAVLSGLGMTLTGSILFANHVVLTEGDSDPIYIYALIQKAVASGKCNLDINSLAIMSTSESRHADVLLRLLCDTLPLPHIVVIADGDKGGKDRLRYIEPLLLAHSIPSKQLAKDTAIEDHMPMLREVYVPALAAYVARLMEIEGKVQPDQGQLTQRFLDDFDIKFEKGKVTQNLSDWADAAAGTIGGISGKPSKVGVAREYAARLLDCDNNDFKWDGRAKALVDWIHENALIPVMHAVDQRILDE
jgi:predicted ATP-dependent endonuclease of OLD family